MSEAEPQTNYGHANYAVVIKKPEAEPQANPGDSAVLNTRRKRYIQKCKNNCIPINHSITFLKMRASSVGHQIMHSIYPTSL